MFAFCMILLFERLIWYGVSQWDIFTKHYMTHYADMEAITDDFYDEISPNYLIKEFDRTINEKNSIIEFIS